MSNICWINGTDVSSLGLEIVEGTTGWHDGIEWDRSSVAIPDRMGHDVSTVEVARPRTIVLRGHVTPSSLATRAASLDTLMYRLNGLLTLKFGDSTSRVVYGKVTRIATADFAGGMALPKVVVEITITCYDPSKWDATATDISFGTAGTEVPVGTLPSVGTIKINGPATTPILRYHDTTPATQGYMSFSTSMASGEYLSIDLDRRRIQFYATSGTATNAMAALASGDFFRLHPTHADLATGAWPTLTVSSGSGVLTHRRRWIT